MDALQRATKLRWEQVDGVQVFTHLWKANATEDRIAIAGWISSLPPDQQATLFQKGIPLESLDKKTQDAVLNLLHAPCWPSGADLPFGLLNTKDQARVFLRFIPLFQFKIPDYGGFLFNLDRNIERTFDEPTEYVRNDKVDFLPLLPASQPASLTFKQ